MSPALILALALAAAPAVAAPARYALEPDGSSVAFAWDFGRDEVTGRMPVSRADLTIDFHPGRRRVDVALDVAGAEAGFPFASQAMSGPKCSTRAHFPQITFHSSGSAPMATAPDRRRLTIRGVTRPMVLQAFYRPGQRRRRSVAAVGAADRRVNRSDFGATGWPDMAGDQVRLRSWPGSRGSTEMAARTARQLRLGQPDPALGDGGGDPRDARLRHRAGPARALARRLWLFALHKSIGLTLLTLALARLAWHGSRRRPRPSRPALAADGGTGRHRALYALILAVPLTGWIASAATGIEVVLWGRRCPGRAGQRGAGAGRL